MKSNYWTKAVIGTACVALATATFAADPPESAAPTSKPAQHVSDAHSSLRPTTKMETVTLDIRGADCPQSVQALETALSSHHVMAKVKVSPDKPYRFTTAIEPTMDLGSVGLAVRDASTTNKSKNPPSLDLVLFSKLDKANTKKALDALTAIKGIDAKSSEADANVGEIHIRIDGGEKLTADPIHGALQHAGVQTQFARRNHSKTG